MRSYYEILGVNRNSSAEEIKAAYRRMARQFHPDRNPGDADAEEAFKAVGEAWQVLRDPERRRRYDLLGLAPAGSQFGDALTPADWSWSGLARRVARQAAQRLKVRKGRDIELELSLSFAEAALGTERILSLPRRVGPSPESPLQERELSFTLPGSLDDGERLRWRGQGAPGEGGGPSGDLWLKIRVRPSPPWARRGRDLYTRLPLTLGERLGGGAFSVEGIDGDLSLAVPAFTPPGRHLRVQGQGARDRRGQRGDLYVEVASREPGAVTPEQLEALRRWEESVFVEGPPDPAERGD